MNNICIIGRMGKDGELRTTSTGKNVASFSVGVTRKFKVNGDSVTDWFNVTVWDKQAEFVCNYLGKGRLVSVVGRMECRKYEDKDGNKREAWDIQASDVSGLDKPKDGAAPAAAVGDDFDPFAE